MSADANAIKVQGPDNWPGNRVAVSTVSTTAIANFNDPVQSFYQGTVGAGGAYMAVTVAGFNAAGNIDSFRTSLSSTPLASNPSTTATRTSADVGNVNGRGLMIHVKISALAGTPTFTPRLDWKDNSGNYVTIWTGAALSANGDSTYLLYPGATTTGSSFTQVVGISIPRIFRLVLVYAGNPASDSATTELDLEIIL